jgi:hypothetical protein
MVNTQPVEAGNTGIIARFPVAITWRGHPSGDTQRHVISFWTSHFGRDARPDPTVNPKHRVYAVGDLHGRYDLLRAMLKRIVEDFEDAATAGAEDRVPWRLYRPWGPVARRARNAYETRGRRALDIVALRGNHEAALARFHPRPNRHRAWLDFGAQQTLASYGVALPRRELSEPTWSICAMRWWRRWASTWSSCAASRSWRKAATWC